MFMTIKSWSSLGKNVAAYNAKKSKLSSNKTWLWLEETYHSSDRSTDSIGTVGSSHSAGCWVNLKCKSMHETGEKLRCFKKVSFLQYKTISEHAQFRKKIQLPCRFFVFFVKTRLSVIIMGLDLLVFSSQVGKK